jgi:hypothetical protein
LRLADFFGFVGLMSETLVSQFSSSNDPSFFQASQYVVILIFHFMPARPVGVVF